MSTKKTFSNETSERYARALFQVVKDSNELDKTENDIKKFQFLLNSSLEIKNFIEDPTQSKNFQIKAINFLSKELEFSKNLQNFFLLLVKKKRIFFIIKIFQSFLQLCSKKRGEIKASLISSKELTQSEIEELSKDLSKYTGSSLNLDYKVDKELIGGLKLQLGSIMIDTSIRNKLKKYEQAMLEN